MGCSITAIPFASLLATFVCFAGVGLFCYAFATGTTVLYSDIIENIFRLSRVLSWIDIFKVVFIVIGVIMALFAIFLLVFGFLATGATRKNIYTGTKCIMGGRLTAAFLMFLSYVLNLIWLLVLVVMSASTLFVILIYSWCKPPAERFDFNRQTVDPTDCFDLRDYGIHLNQTELQYKYTDFKLKTRLCSKNDINAFCNKIDVVAVHYMLALAGALLVVISLVHFMIALAANYTRIKTSREYSEWRQLMQLQDYPNSAPYTDYEGGGTYMGGGGEDDGGYTPTVGEYDTDPLQYQRKFPSLSDDNAYYRGGRPQY